MSKLVISLLSRYKPLELPVECTQYILSGGVRSGCQFSRNSLAEFSDIIFCVNGSSSEGSLKPVFASLQIQNHSAWFVFPCLLFSHFFHSVFLLLSHHNILLFAVKPAAVEKMDLKTISDKQLELLWENPMRRLPGHCMEWEVEHSRERPDGNRTLVQLSYLLLGFFSRLAILFSQVYKFPAAFVFCSYKTLVVLMRTLIVAV